MLVRQVSLFQIGVHLLAVLPGLWLAFEYFTGRLGVNPIQALTLRTGKLALVMLMLSLVCTPVNTLFGFRPAVKARRPLGLYAFFYALTHLMIFSGLDFGFDWGLLSQEVTEKPYIWVGLSAFTILSILAVTSFRWWMKRLGKNWKRLHRLVYIAGVLVVVHYAWVVKGDILTLQGDILQPLAFGGVLALMLLVRLPAVRRWIAAWKGKISLGVQKRARQAQVKGPPSQAG
jgi:methionine sulfoxide reductase heme-binding subunit